MSANSSVQLSVGSIIQMDDANITDKNGNWTLEFNDIFLTESEIFWQEQELDCGFDLILSEESPASEGFLFTGSTSKQTLTVPRDEFLINEAPSLVQSPFITFGDTNEILMPDKLSCFTDKSILKIGKIDALASSTGMSSEQTLPSDEGSEAMCEIGTGMGIEQSMLSEAVDEGMNEIEMIDQSACLTDMQPVGSVYLKVDKTR